MKSFDWWFTKTTLSWAYMGIITAVIFRLTLVSLLIVPLFWLGLDSFRYYMKKKMAVQ